MTQSTAVTDGRQIPTESCGGHKLRNLRVVGGFLDGTSFDLVDALNCAPSHPGLGNAPPLP